MFTVHIVGSEGTEARFDVPNPVLALDLALRADRLGLLWRAAHADRTQPLSLWLLRDLAQRAAAGEPASAAHLEAVVTEERLAAGARLN